MIKTYLFKNSEVIFDVPMTDWRSALGNENGFFWLDLRSVDRDELDEVAQIFGLHSVTVESCIDPYHRPHIHEFTDHFYVNLTLLKINSKATDIGIKASELHLFVGDKFIITFSKEDESPAVDNVLNQYMACTPMCESGTLHVVYLLVDRLVETYLPIVEKLDSEADRLEDIMLGNADKRSVKRLFTLKRKGFELRKLLGPQRDVFSELARREFSFIEKRHQIYFQDAYNRMIRVFDMLDTIREILSGSLDIYLSTVSNRLNEVMKVLTVVSTILMTVSFITGFYGMNFVHLPGLNAPDAFRNIVISMGVITAIMLYMFKRKGWL